MLRQFGWFLPAVFVLLTLPAGAQDVQGQAQAAPTSIPITNDMPPAVAEMLRQAQQGNPNVKATPLQPAQVSNPQAGAADASQVAAPAAPQAAAQVAPQAVAPPVPTDAAAFPGATELAPGSQVQFLQGTKYVPGKPAAPKEASIPQWASEVLTQQKKLEEDQEKKLEGVDPQDPARVAAQRTPSRQVPAAAPEGLPAPKYARLVQAVEAGDLRDAENHILRGEDLNQLNAEGRTPVLIAALSGDLAMLELLLDYGATPDFISSVNPEIPVVAAAEHQKWGSVGLLRQFGAIYTAWHAASLGDLRTLMDMLEEEPALLSDFDLARNALLHSATYGNHPEIIEFLVQQGAEVSPRNSNGDSPLSIAVEYNLEASVRKLAELGADMNERLAKGESVLHRKARKGDTQTVELVLSLGGLIDSRDNEGFTPLHTAARSGQAQMIEFLLQHGAPIEAQDNNGGTALHAAAGAGTIEAIKTLISKGAAIAAPDMNGASPLLAAARAGRFKAFVFLLEMGADLQSCSSSGATALHAAVEGAGAVAPGRDKIAGITDEVDQRIRLINFAIEKGLSPQRADGLGTLPLHVAAQNGQTVIAAVLLDNGTPVDAPDSSGRTALICAFERAYPATARMLIEQGANIKATDAIGRTVLHVAAQGTDSELVRELIVSGAELAAIDQNGRTTVHYAAEKGSADVLRMLLALGAPLNTPDVAARLPLHLAADRGESDIVKVLVGNGAQLDAQDNHGRQALHVAAGANRAQALEVLLEAGADPNKPDQDGYSPLHVATQMGHAELARLLMRYHAQPNLRTLQGKSAGELALDTKNPRLIRLLKSSTPTGLESAIQKGDVAEVERLLAENRAMVNARFSGSPALHVACRAGNKELVELLLGYGATVSLAETGNPRAMPLHVAAEAGHLDIVKMLLVMGADTNVQNAAGAKPEDLAQVNGHAEVAAAIRAYAEKHAGGAGAPLEKPVRRSLFGFISAGNGEGLKGLLDEYPGLFSGRFLNHAPMQLAVTMNKRDIVALLLERGADPNAKVEPAMGRSALHEAANRGYVEIVQLLLQAGADTKALDKLNQTPLDLANLNHFQDVVKLLQQQAPQETE